MSEEKTPDLVNVTDPFGKVGSLPKEQANEALDNGYRPATMDEVTAAKNEDKYGGVQGSIFAGALGAARTATLGASDLALTNLPEGVGFSPEELKGFEETNPVSNAVGAVGGLLRDPLGLAKAIGSAGKATTAAGKAAIKAAGIVEDSSLAARALSTGANAAGMGVEGALYGGVAGSTNELALGDQSLNSEKVLANVGYGALLGGATGAAFKVLGFGITPAIRKATDALADIRNDLIGSGYGEKALIQKVMPERLADAITDRQLNLDTKGQASVLRRIVTNLNSVTNNVTDEIKNFESDVDPKAMSALFNSSSKASSGAQKMVTDYLNNAIEYVKGSLPEFPTQGQQLSDSVVPRSRLYGLLDSLKEEMKSGSSEKIFNTLKDLSSKIGDVIKKEPEAEEALAPVNQAINEFRKDPTIFGAAGAASTLHEENVSKLSEFISQDNKLTPFQKTFGNAVDGKWQFDIKKLNSVLSDKNPEARSANIDLLNKFFSQMKEMPENLLNARRSIPNNRWRSQTLKQVIENSEKSTQEAFEDYTKGINKRRPLYGWKDYAPVLIAKWHPVLAAAIEAYDFYQDPVHATHGLSLVERILSQTSKKSLDLMDEIFTPSTSTRGLIEGKINNLNDKAQNDNEEHQDNIKKWASNPETTSENLMNNTKELAGYAPGIAQNLHISAGNAVSFLASKLPQTNDHLNPLGGEAVKPGTNEMAKFNRYRSVVENPLTALMQIKDRTITPETVETLSSVYPKLYEEMKQSLIEKAFEQKSKGKTIPFQTRQAISMFIGEPLDSSLSPQSILSNQLILDQSQKQNQMAQSQPKIRAKGLDKMDRTGRVAADYGAMDEKV